MKLTTKIFVIAAALFALNGCASLSRSDEITLRELKASGISSTDIKVKSPALAGSLNILPGIGNFYLAAGTNESGQWLYGFLNLLTWPISVLWGIPEAAVDANTINKQETVYYYTFDPTGKRELENIKMRNAMN